MTNPLNFNKNDKRTYIFNENDTILIYITKKP